MTKTIDLLFTADEICERARDNLTAISLVAAAYLKRRQLSIPEFWTFTGHLFAKSWEPDLTARDFAEVTALNMLSANSELQALSGDASRAEIVLSGWPGDEALAEFDLTQVEADYITDIFVAIGQDLGFQCLWERAGDHLKMVVTPS